MQIAFGVVRLCRPYRVALQQEWMLNLKNVDKYIVISLQDDATGTEFLFEATINDTGRLGGAGVTLDARLYAQHDGSPPSQRPRGASASCVQQLVILGDGFGG